MPANEYPTRIIDDNQPFKLDNYYHEKSRAKARFRMWHSRGYRVRTFRRGDRFVVYISIKPTRG